MSAAIKNIQEAYNAGNMQKAKEHAQKAVGLSQKLEQENQEIFNKFTQAHEKAKNADEVMKTQIVVVAPTKNVKDYKKRVRAVMRPEDFDVSDWEDWD